MTTFSRAIFSFDGELCASTDEDGSLKIWETSKNHLKSKYNFKSHVNQTISSLTWGNKIATADNTDDNLPSIFLIIGSQEGSVLLYDVTTQTLHNLVSGHADAVTDIQYDQESDLAYSCSLDTSIISWNLSERKIKLKWKSGEEPISSLCLIDKNNLLSSGTSILWWDIEKQIVVKKFNGCGSKISMLLPVSDTITSHTYFLSITEEEELIYAWHLSPKNSQVSSATFKLIDFPKSIDVTNRFSKKEPMMLSAVIEKGSLVLFKYVLNGQIRRNLTPVTMLQILSKAKPEISEPSVIPILASKFVPDSNSCIIAYGNIENPVFEKVELSEGPKNLILSREIPLSKIKSEKSLNNSITMLNGQDYALDPTLNSPKRRKKDPENHVEEFPQTEVTSVPVDMPSEISTPVPKSPSGRKKELKQRTPEITNVHPPISPPDITTPTGMVNALMQSFELPDEKLLNMVLKCDDDALIKNSIRILPFRNLKEILQVLHKKLKELSYCNSSSTRKWLKEILSTHLSYLSNCSDTSEVITEIQNDLEERRVSDTLLKLSSLKGLLHMLRIHGAFVEETISDNENMDS